MNDGARGADSVLSGLQEDLRHGSRARRRLLALPVLRGGVFLALAAGVGGCGLTLGPRVEERIIFVRHQGVAARVAESKEVEVIVEHEGKVYRDRVNIGGFYVISPDLKDEKKPSLPEP